MLQAQALPAGVSFQQTHFFGLLLIFTMAERLAAFGADVAIERDWVTQLVGELLGQPLGECSIKPNSNMKFWKLVERGAFWVGLGREVIR